MACKDIPKTVSTNDIPEWYYNMLYENKKTTIFVSQYYSVEEK